MELDELLINLNISHKEFIEEAVKVKSYAPLVGKSMSNKDMYSSIMIHDISDEIIDLDLPYIDRINMLFQLYDIAPSYTVLMYLVMIYDKLSIELKGVVMMKYSDYLYNCDEYLSEPVSYSLWVDYFEGNDRVGFCFETIYQKMQYKYNDIKKLVEVSSSVPYNLKREFYESMVSDNELHELVYEGIINSVSDTFGYIEPSDALRLLNQLDIDRSTETYKALAKRLGL